MSFFSTNKKIIIAAAAIMAAAAGGYFLFKKDSRFDVDTSNEFYDGETQYYDEKEPVFNNLVLEYVKKLYNSPYRDYLEKKIGPVAFKNMELAQKSMNEKIVPLMQEENALTMEYNKLIAGAKIDFDGKELNLSLLRPYLEAQDRDVRAAAWEKQNEFFASLIYPFSIVL